MWGRPKATPRTNVIVYWFRPWISFWAIRSTLLYSCCCILLFYQSLLSQERVPTSHTSVAVWVQVWPCTIVFRPPAMTAMVLCVVLGALLYVLNAVPPTVLVLASLLLLCIIAKCHRKSGRLQMLIVTHFICLAPIFSGFSCLLLWPSLCISLAFSLWLLRSVSFLLATKVQSMVTRKSEVNNLDVHVQPTVA